MEDKKTITFKEYWEKYKTPATILSERTGMNYYQIYNLIKRGYTSFEVAASIELYTNGEVPCINMLQKEKLDKVKAYQEERNGKEKA